MEDTQSVIYDVLSDPGQVKPITDRSIFDRLNKEMMRLINENDAPMEVILRMEASIRSSLPDI